MENLPSFSFYFSLLFLNRVWSFQEVKSWVQQHCKKGLWIYLIWAGNQIVCAFHAELWKCNGSSRSIKMVADLFPLCVTFSRRRRGLRKDPINWTKWNACWKAWHWVPNDNFQLVGNGSDSGGGVRTPRPRAKNKSSCRAKTCNFTKSDFFYDKCLRLLNLFSLPHTNDHWWLILPDFREGRAKASSPGSTVNTSLLSQSSLFALMLPVCLLMSPKLWECERWLPSPPIRFTNKSYEIVKGTEPEDPALLSTTDVKNGNMARGVLK